MTQAKADPAQVLASGAAYETFQHWIAAQGGDLDAFERSSPATEVYTLKAPTSGYVQSIDALKLGQAVKLLGGGRSSKGDELDLDVGIRLEKKVGDGVVGGEGVLELYHKRRGFEAAQRLVQESIIISPDVVRKPKLVLAEVS